MEVFYLLLAETTNTILDVGIVFEPLILRYGAFPCPKMVTPSITLSMRFRNPVDTVSIA